MASAGDILPDESAIVDGNSTSAGTDSDWMSPPLAGATSAELQTRLQAAQDALEAKEFAMLEAQASHARALREMRRENEAKDARIRELEAEARALRTELRAAENRTLRAALEADEDRTRLQRSIEMLQLQLGEARAAAEAAADRSARGGGRTEAAVAAASAASAQAERLQAALTARDSELAALRRELSSAMSSRVSRDSELEEVRAHSIAQEGRIRALHDQLSTFIAKDASEAARAQLAESELEETRRQLAKRLGQLKKVIAALNAVREREAALAGALEAQTELASQLQQCCATLSEDLDRASRAKDALQRQYDAALAENATLSDKLEAAVADAAAGADVVTAATHAAERIEALNRALAAAAEERASLLDELGNAKADARRELLSLQRVADDRGAVIRGLQADLSAATAALGAAAGSHRAGSAAVNFASAFAGSAASAAGGDGRGGGGGGGAGVGSGGAGRGSMGGGGGGFADSSTGNAGALLGGDAAAAALSISISHASAGSGPSTGAGAAPAPPRRGLAIGSTGGRPIQLRTLQPQQLQQGATAADGGFDSDLSHHDAVHGSAAAAAEGGGVGLGFGLGRVVPVPAAAGGVRGPPGALYTDSALAVETAASAAGEAVTLRLQVESLSRRLQASESRLSAAQAEQDALLLANERLRHALETSGPGAASTATAEAAALAPGRHAAAASSASAPAACSCGNGGAGEHALLARAVAVCLLRLLVDLQPMLRAASKLLSSQRRLRDSCRAALEGRSGGGPGAGSGGGGGIIGGVFGLDALREEEEAAGALLPTLPVEAFVRGCTKALPAVATSVADTSATLPLLLLSLLASVSALPGEAAGAASHKHGQAARQGQALQWLLADSGESPVAATPAGSSWSAGSTASGGAAVRALSVLDGRAAAAVLIEEAAAADSLRSEVEERSAAALGDACVTQ